MSDQRTEALRLATIISDDPATTVARAEAYLAFLQGAPSTAAPKEAKTTPKKETPAPKPTPEPEPKPDPVAEDEPASEYTIDQVRAALKEYRGIEGATAMLEIIKTHGGAEQLTSVDPSKFGAIMEAINAAD